MERQKLLVLFACLLPGLLTTGDRVALAPVEPLTVYVHPQGDDAHDGRSSTSAIKSLSRLAELLAGAEGEIRVRLRNGETHEGTLLLQGAGTAHLRVEGYGPGGRPVLKPQASAGDTAGIRLEGAFATVTVEKLDIQGFATGVRASIAGRVGLTGCRIHDYGSVGVHLLGEARIRLEGCEVLPREGGGRLAIHAEVRSSYQAIGCRISGGREGVCSHEHPLGGADTCLLDRCWMRGTQAGFVLRHRAAGHPRSLTRVTNCKILAEGDGPCTVIMSVGRARIEAYSNTIVNRSRGQNGVAFAAVGGEIYAQANVSAATGGARHAVESDPDLYTGDSNLFHPDGPRRFGVPSDANLAAWKAATGEDTFSSSAVPGLRDPEGDDPRDFDLREDAAARGRALPHGHGAVDYDGEKRPRPGHPSWPRWDVGADQFVPKPTGGAPPRTEPRPGAPRPTPRSVPRPTAGTRRGARSGAPQPRVQRYPRPKPRPRAPAPANAIPFTVFQDTQDSVDQECIGATICLGRSRAVLSTASLVVRDEQGKLTPAQFQVLNRWKGTIDDATAPIKMLRVWFKGSVDAAPPHSQAFAFYSLDVVGENEVNPPGRLVPTDHGDHVRIAMRGEDTVWEIETGAVTLFRSATVLGRRLIDTPGGYVLVGSSGEPLVLEDVITKVVDGGREEGAVRIVVEQSARVRPQTKGIDDGLSVDIEYVFLDQERADRRRDVRVRVRLKNEAGGWNRKKGTLGVRFIREFYLTAPLVNDGSLTVRSSTGTTEVKAAGPDYKLQATVREILGRHYVYKGAEADLSDWDYGGLGSGVRPAPGQRHLMSFVEGLDGTETRHEGESHPEAIGIAGREAGVLVSIRDFSEKAPHEIRVAQGRLHVGLWPREIPGQPLFRLIPARPSPWWDNQPVLQIKNPQGFPSGNNVIGGRWQNGDVAPPGFPGPRWQPVDPKPTAPGQEVGAMSPGGAWRWAGSDWTFEAGLPKHPVDDRYVDNYPIAVGHWRTTLRLGFFPKGAPAGEDIAAIASRNEGTVLGLCSADRYAETGALGPRRLLTPPVVGGSVRDFDAERYERWIDGLVDPFAVDPMTAGAATRPNPSGWYWSFQTVMNSGSGSWRGSTWRVFGKDVYGTWAWGGLSGNSFYLSNNHYQAGWTMALQAIRKQDVRFWSHARPICRYTCDHVCCHGGELGNIRGISYYESVIWAGHEESQVGRIDHTWITDEVALYLFDADRWALETLRLRKDSLLSDNGYWSTPSLWHGIYSIRHAGWGMKAVTDFDVHVGPERGPNGKTPEEEVRDTMILIHRLESGKVKYTKATRARGPGNQNIIPASQSVTGADIDVSGRGFILDPGYRGPLHLNTWVYALTLRAMCDALRWYEWDPRGSEEERLMWEVSDRMGRWLYDIFVVEPGHKPAFPAYWTAPESARQKVVTWMGARAVGWGACLPGTFLTIKNTFEGTPFEKTTQKDYDWASRAEIAFRWATRYFGLEWGNRPGKPLHLRRAIDPPTEPIVYDQGSGQPVAEMSVVTWDVNGTAGSKPWFQGMLDNLVYWDYLVSTGKVRK